MILPDQTPKLPKWPFLAADAVLLAAAALIGAHASLPLRTHAILAITACVVLAAVAGAIPFLADYARRQDEALDNRQRALEALARNTTSAAEQISIAAAALHDMATRASKGWDDAAQLPTKLREQAAEAAAQAAKARTEDRKALEKEFAALRAASAEKIQAAADKIVEAALARVPVPSPSAPVLIAPLPKEKPSRPPARTIETPVAEAAPLVEAPASPPPPVVAPKSETPAPQAPAPQQPAKDDFLPNLTIEPITPDTPAPAEAAVAKAAVVEAAATEAAAPKAAPAQAAAAKAAPAEAPSGAQEGPKPSRKRAPKKPAPVEEARPEPEAAASAASEFVQPAPDEVAPPASIAADGASRLLVTAYIGIGNRLFIRGEGPGLSWERGVPLQFVSIGKWRWDTNEATAPIRFKLYKNDEVECAPLGTNSLDPGRQLEVSASFNP